MTRLGRYWATWSQHLMARSPCLQGLGTIKNNGKKKKKLSTLLVIHVFIETSQEEMGSFRISYASDCLDNTKTWPWPSLAIMPVFVWVISFQSCHISISQDQTGLSTLHGTVQSSIGIYFNIWNSIGIYRTILDLSGLYTAI